MRSPEFEVVLSRTGKVTVEVKGAKGPRCLEYADMIKEIIGREEERRLTTEFYAPDGQVRIDAQIRDRSK